MRKLDYQRSETAAAEQALHRLGITKDDFPKLTGRVKRVLSGIDKAIHNLPDMTPTLRDRVWRELRETVAEAMETFKEEMRTAHYAQVSAARFAEGLEHREETYGFAKETLETIRGLKDTLRASIPGRDD